MVDADGGIALDGTGHRGGVARRWDRRQTPPRDPLTIGDVIDDMTDRR